MRDESRLVAQNRIQQRGTKILLLSKRFLTNSACPARWLVHSGTTVLGEGLQIRRVEASSRDRADHSRVLSTRPRWRSGFGLFFGFFRLFFTVVGRSSNLATAFFWQRAVKDASLLSADTRYPSHNRFIVVCSPGRVSPH